MLASQRNCPIRSKVNVIGDTYITRSNKTVKTWSQCLMAASEGIILQPIPRLPSDKMSRLHRESDMSAIALCQSSLGVDRPRRHLVLAVKDSLLRIVFDLFITASRVIGVSIRMHDVKDTYEHRMLRRAASYRRPHYALCPPPAKAINQLNIRKQRRNSGAMVCIESAV